MSELKPCPFCGAAAKMEHTRSGDDFVRCTDPSCHARTRNYHENDVGARDAWNERADDNTLRELVEAMASRLRWADEVTGGGVLDARLKRQLRELGIEVDG